MPLKKVIVTISGTAILPAGIYREYEILHSKKIYSEIVSSIPGTAN